MSIIKPEGQQVDALKLMKQWYRNHRKGVSGTPPFFYLAGYAGTGKTFLVKHFLKEEKLENHDVRLMTFMARSAMVLGKASGLPATTIHSQIYKLRTVNGRDEWVINEDSDVRAAELIILDECSMIGKKMFMDILYFNRPVLILGDPGQFLPINDEPFFQALQPDFFLEEIRRQALDNPIIRLSMAARQGQAIPFGEYGAARKVPLGSLQTEDWLKAEVVLAHSNNQRRAFNGAYRSVLGYDQQSLYPIKGDRLICLKNKHDLGLTNGLLGTCENNVEQPKYLNQLTVRIDFKPEGLDVPLKTDLDVLSSYFVPKINNHGLVIPDPDFAKHRHLHFDYGYCITAHKALGSQFDSVLVVDDGSARDYNRWLYVAVTRAVETLSIVVP